MKQTIKSVDGSILFECKATTIKDAVLSAIESRANLIGANLSRADLSMTYLSGANLSGADLSMTYLIGANLSGADLSGANLSGANLFRANLSGADLSGAYIIGANLIGADLSGAYLSGAEANESTAMFFSQCPAEGSFIAWKKAGGLIVKLRVTEKALRSSATTLKCRCSEAEVLAIENIDGTPSSEKSVKSSRDGNFLYTVGDIVSVEDFDTDRWNECSTGIHFFIDRNCAVQY